MEESPQRVQSIRKGWYTLSPPLRDTTVYSRGPHPRFSCLGPPCTYPELGTQTVHDPTLDEWKGTGTKELTFYVH